MDKFLMRSSNRGGMELRQILIQRGLIAPEKLSSVIARKSDNSQLGDFLLREGLIKDDDLQIALREQHWRSQGLWSF
jgi:hypothetical protein